MVADFCPEFYDHIVIKNILDQEFVMAKLRGLFGKYPLRVGDGCMPYVSKSDS